MLLMLIASLNLNQEKVVYLTKPLKRNERHNGDNFDVVVGLCEHYYSSNL